MSNAALLKKSIHYFLSDPLIDGSVHIKLVAAKWSASVFFSQLLDAESLQAPLQSVEGICVTDVVWHTGALKGDGHTLKVLLNATLRWQYPTQQARHFRIHWRHLRGPDPRIPPGPLTLIGRSYSTLYRVLELEVPAAPGLIELVVEPVSREGFRVPEAQWGRRTLSYSTSSSESPSM